MYHDYTPEKWFIDYRLNINAYSENNLNAIDNKLEFIKIKDNLADDRFTSYINSVIANSAYHSKTQKLLTGLKDLDIRSHVIKFKSDNIDNLDNQIDELLIEINEIVKVAMNERMKFYLNAMVERGAHTETNEITTLRKNIQIISDIQGNSEIFDKDVILKPIVFSILSQELQINNITSGNLNSTGLIDKDMFASTNSLISVLELIYEKKVEDLINFEENYRIENYDFQKLIKKRNQIIDSPYLYRAKKNMMNKKPNKLFIITSFLFIGFLLSIIITFFYLGRSILVTTIKKKLVALLSQE